MKEIYGLPDDGICRVINFSGGRSSAFMLRKILEACDFDLPETAVVCFANTGKEMPETLDFVDRCSREWDVEIHWLEYVGRSKAECAPGEFANDYREVDYFSAARDGEPFQSLIDRSRFLPNIHRRICTHELKVETIDRFVRRGLGWEPGYRNVLGIRFDEQRRWQRMLSDRAGCSSELPMVRARVTVDDVQDFWQSSAFDLGISGDWGNCDLCFLKGRQKVQSLIQMQPARAEWWLRQESKSAGFGRHCEKRGGDWGFTDRWTYAGLLASTRRQPDMFLSPGDALGRGVSSEQVAVADCFCGD